MGKLWFVCILIFSMTNVWAVVNINTASVTTLQTLPHIGLVKAKAIIEYRQSHGTFKSKEDITKVKGIGQKTYEKLKNDISVSDDKAIPAATSANKPITNRAAVPITLSK